MPRGHKHQATTLCSGTADSTSLQQSESSHFQGCTTQPSQSSQGRFCTKMACLICTTMALPSSTLMRLHISTHPLQLLRLRRQLLLQPTQLYRDTLLCISHQSTSNSRPSSTRMRGMPLMVDSGDGPHLLQATLPLHTRPTSIPPLW